MIKANDFTATANTPGLIGTPYQKKDCQGLIEAMLALCGLHRDWRGSNDMRRNALSWFGTIDECIAQFGMIPPGAWCFTIKWDGGEAARGYKDGLGNAAHVGAYLGDGKVIHSTTPGGVQWDVITSKRWTHVGLAKDIDYTNTAPAAPMWQEALDKLIQARSLIDTAIKFIREENT